MPGVAAHRYPFRTNNVTTTECNTNEISVAT